MTSGSSAVALLVVIPADFLRQACERVNPGFLEFLRCFLQVSVALLLSSFRKPSQAVTNTKLENRGSAG